MCGAADAQITKILSEIFSFVSQQIFLLNFYHSNSCPAHRGVKKERQTQRIGQRHTVHCVGKGTHVHFTLCFEAQIVQPVCAQTAWRIGQYNLRGSVLYLHQYLCFCFCWLKKALWHCPTLTGETYISSQIRNLVIMRFI